MPKPVLLIRPVGGQSMRHQFHIKHLLWLVLITAGLLAIVRKEPEFLLVIYILAVSYAAFLVAGRAMEVLDGLWDTGWAGVFSKRTKGDRVREAGPLVLGIMIGGFFWICAIGAGAMFYKFFSR